ncbi:hypothetical protein JCM18237_10460 [Halorubrum luteum]
MATATDATDRVPTRLRGARGAAYLGGLAGSLAMLAYLVVLVGYLATTGTEVIDPSRAMYPAVWFSLSAAALGAAFGAPDATTGEGATRSARWPVAVGVGYVLLLAGVSGGLSIGVVGTGLSVSGGLPGWGPVVVADLLVASAIVVPFQTTGYVVLGALLVRALAATAGSLLAGVVGLFTCAGCVLPVVAAVASAGSVPLLAGGLSYAVSTVAFAVTAVVLVGVIVRERTGRDRCEL